MIRHFCDRCEKQCEALIAVAVEATQEKAHVHEICNGCYRQLVDFFKPLPKELPDPRRIR